MATAGPQGLAFVLSTMLAASTVFLGGCGEDGALSTEEYFLKLEKLMQDADEEFTPLQEQLNQDFESDTAEIQAIRDFYAADAENVTSLFADIKALNPPNEVGDDHDEFVLAGEELAEAISQISDGLTAVESVDEMNSLIESEINKPAVRFDEACRGLQRLAFTHGVEIDLDCV